MSKVSEEILAHVGTPHEGNIPHSGRYQYGSGEQPYQNGMDFLERVKYLKREGLSDTEIVESMKLKSTGDLRNQKAVANEEIKLEQYANVIKLKEAGFGPTYISRKIGIKEPTVRNWLKNRDAASFQKYTAVSRNLKEQVDRKGIVDVGEGTEAHLGISKEAKNKALDILEMQGYNVFKNQGIHQVTNPNQITKTIYLATPDKTRKDVYDYQNVHQLDEVEQYRTPKDIRENKKREILTPRSLDSKRLMVNYAEEGGKDKDGVIELRRGAKDLTLGESKYSQVRILVDGKYYLKGMAIYSDDLPKGVDVRFNTNKPKGTPVMDPGGRGVLKKIKEDDPKNPFGSLIDYQTYYTDKNGKEQQSLINVTRTEGDWEGWRKSLPSQFIGKQPKSLIDKQIKITELRQKADFEDIKKLNNPVIKKKLLEEFASERDSDAVDLQLMAFPRQKTQVILPVNSLKENEVYAPNFKNGDTVALIRFPHAGQFEIPICKVNNRNKEGKEVITPSAKDAVGVNQKTAQILSGADFDGDTVVMVPITNTIKIKNKKRLDGLASFDPDVEFPERKGMTYLSEDNKQIEMGKISNLITDMTIKGATEPELERAVKHSMVIIDAVKHKYDYKLSEKVNNIKELKKKYQKHTHDEKYGGASTLLSKSKSPIYVEGKQVGSSWIEGSREGEPVTGKVKYKVDKGGYTNKDGKWVPYKTKTTKMANTEDAMSLISDVRHPVEIAYANHANFLKNLANEARKEILSVKNIKMNKEAKIKYAEEVTSLKNKLNIAKKNRPIERQAQRIATSKIEALKKDNPVFDRKSPMYDKELLQKRKQQYIEQARIDLGADSKGTRVKITDKEWEAIQSGAISSTMLSEIIKRSDSEELRKLATPKTSKVTLTAAKKAGIKAMLAAGYTNEEIAERFGVSVSTIVNVDKK